MTPPAPVDDAFWRAALAHLAPGPLRPVQQAALDAGLLDLASRRNFIVSAPTNTGKTLVGDLACLNALRRGKRAVLLEPLRALAQEKHEEWTARRALLQDLIRQTVQVILSTGDYRLEDERFTDLPGPADRPGTSERAELVIATPEKLEALLRRPEHAAWFATIDVVVVDEAHMLSSRHRGPTLELLLSRLKAAPNPPRFVLLSGTVGDTDQAQRWLAPCDVVRVTERSTPLTLSVDVVADGQTPDETTLQWTQQVLGDPNHQVLIFVYQTASAAKLARTLEQAHGPGTARAYHAQMSRAARADVKAAFLSGQCRVIVSTTALALGLNLPCSHVLVRDATFAGVGRLEVDTLLQMLGRAGRGSQPGAGTVLLRPSDAWQPEELRMALGDPTFPPLHSAFERLDPGNRQPAEAVAATLLAAHTAPVPASELERVLSHSLGGHALSGQVRSALRGLERQKLAWQAAPASGGRAADGPYALTWLGRRAVRAVIPLPAAAGTAQLLRDLMLTDPQDDLLSHWRPMDTLLIANLLHERPPNLGWRWSEKLATRVDEWCEQFGADAPHLATFVRGAPGISRAHELLGSLGLPLPPGRKAEAEARKVAYQALARAAVLFERSSGRPMTDVERRWDIKNLAGVEERWRDDLLWLLVGMAELLDLPGYLYHLKEQCSASDDRLRRVKTALRRQTRQVWALQEGLKRCSPLGNLLNDVRRQHLGRTPKIGQRSIQKLEDAGIHDIATLLTLREDDLHQLGIRRMFARQLLRHLARRQSI